MTAEQRAVDRADTGASAAEEPGAKDSESAVERMRAVAAGLEAAGLTVRLRRSIAGCEITASAHRPGGRETEVVIDDDGYVELRYWSPPGATAAQIADVITRAVAVVHGPLERGR